MPKTTLPTPHPVPAIHRRVPQHLARRFSQICNALLSHVSEPYGLMNWHFGLLVQIRETPGMDRGSLAAAIGADATSTGQVLEMFVARGLVLRATQPGDRRAASFALTTAGEAMFQALAGPTRDVARQLLSPLSAAEADMLLELLGRLVDAHEAHARPGVGRRAPKRKSADRTA